MYGERIRFDWATNDWEHLPCGFLETKLVVLLMKIELEIADNSPIIEYCLIDR